MSGMRSSRTMWALGTGSIQTVCQIPEVAVYLQVEKALNVRCSPSISLLCTNAKIQLHIWLAIPSP